MKITCFLKQPARICKLEADHGKFETIVLEYKYLLLMKLWKFEILFEYIPDEMQMSIVFRSNNLLKTH